MRDWGAVLIYVAIALAILIAAAGLTTCGVWTWQQAQDKRDCRRHGGAVTYQNGDGGPSSEWHCVGATPEAK